MALSLHDLSPRAQVLVFVVLCATTVAAAWQMLLAPDRANIATRQDRLATVQAEAARAAAVARRLPAFEKEVAALEQQLVETTSVLPDEKDSQEVLRRLYTLATESSLEIANFTPKPLTTRAQYAEWPIELGLQGSYHDLGRFFDKVASLPLLISVADLHIRTKAQPTGKGSVSVTCVATTYIFRQDVGLTITGGQL